MGNKRSTLSDIAPQSCGPSKHTTTPRRWWWCRMPCGLVVSTLLVAGDVPNACMNNLLKTNHRNRWQICSERKSLVTADLCTLVPFCHGRSAHPDSLLDLCLSALQ